MARNHGEFPHQSSQKPRSKTKNFSKNSRKKFAQKPNEQGIYLQKIEKNFPEISFFRENNNPISRIQSRIYGLLSHNENIKNIRESNNHNDRKNEKISNIIHETSHLSNLLAYASHNGKNWRRDGIRKMQDALLKQFQGGRAMEVLLTEAMMNTKEKTGDGIDFLPVKELDLSFKTDMMTRLPYKQNNTTKTFSIGTQITLAEIGDEKYENKHEQVKSSIPFIENNVTQAEIIEKYGRMYTTDMMSYIAINGSIREHMIKDRPALNNFRKWRKNGFDSDGLLDYFPKNFQEKMKIIAENVFETQKYLMSKEFVMASGKNFKKTEKMGENYHKKIQYNPNSRELTLSIYDKNEQLMKATFWLTDKNFSKIFDINYES